MLANCACILLIIFRLILSIAYLTAGPDYVYSVGDKHFSNCCKPFSPKKGVV